MIDDAHALDRESWTILIQTIDNPNILSVVTVPNTWKVSDGCVFDFVNHPSVIGMRLEGLNIQDIGPLAGQIMHVQAVPQDLPKYVFVLVINYFQGI
ncbi:hypothetical protein O3M35_003221 [Rhynocoris fuscipes]|uniref:Uncharacterized protein n=1 Tax=Rhynocoris fuscipes TaxID=488301 RepID=A0AAW1CJL7_9HEMI